MELSSAPVMLSSRQIPAVFATLFLLLVLFINFSMAFAPPKLQPGATIGFVSPAYSVTADGQNWTVPNFIAHVEQGIASMGYKVTCNNAFIIFIFWMLLRGSLRANGGSCERPLGSSRLSTNPPPPFLSLRICLWNLSLVSFSSFPI